MSLKNQLSTENCTYDNSEDEPEKGFNSTNEIDIKPTNKVAPNPGMVIEDMPMDDEALFVEKSHGSKPQSYKV